MSLSAASSYPPPHTLYLYRLPPEVISEAQKKCKFASSALDYDDVAGAVEYLTEALKMLKK